MRINTFKLRETRVAKYVGELGVESIAEVGPWSGKSRDLAIVGVVGVAGEAKVRLFVLLMFFSIFVEPS